MPDRNFEESDVKAVEGELPQKMPKVNLTNCYKYVPKLKELLNGDDENIASMLTYAEECYRAGQLIAEMAQSMHGFDTMAFSAGIGENSDVLRTGVARELEWLGVSLDPEKNKLRSDDPRIISTDDSKVKVLVVPTNEELMIAFDVEELLHS